MTQEHRAFQDEIERVLPRLLALFDRDPTSPCYGLGDRLYWGWKLIDYPNATHQGAVNGLARLLAANLLPPWLSHRSILERIDSAIAAAGRLVAGDGSLVEAFPKESSFCVTALIAYDILSAAESLRGIVDEGRITAWRSTAAPMIDFLIRNDEHHAIISNHLATAAAALTRAAAAHGHPGAESRAKVFLDRILRHQSPEGWFCEYGAADPGYETLGLCYLADIHCRRPDLRLEDALRRCLGFLVHAAHPDGSFGGHYGSRNTRFVVPGGTFKLSSSGNSEILFVWLKMAIANRYEAAFPALEHFLTSQGRRKFVAPLYADLAKTDWGKTMAMRIYTQARPTYHSVSVGTIDKSLGWPAAGSSR